MLSGLSANCMASCLAHMSQKILDMFGELQLPAGTLNSAVAVFEDC